MISRLSYILSNGTNPFENIALEEELLNVVARDECILYLWQNSKTVVIGRNQNCHRECKVQQLEEAGGQVARRLSGGGAVFHDMGNLNFTFVVGKDNYNLDTQTEVILRAVKSLGVTAERTGRNDIVADGRKFSGNAYYSRRGSSYHHGTLLVNADMSMMSRYLTVSEDKLQSHGVKSVQSRVVNLAELVPDITIDSLRDAMLAAFGEVYGGVPEQLDGSRLNLERMEKRREHFSSWEWRVGSNPSFSSSLRHRFGWGSVELGVVVGGGVITEAKLYTDALAEELARIVSEVLLGVRFAPEELRQALNAVHAPTDEVSRMSRDIATIVEELFR